MMEVGWGNLQVGGRFLQLVLRPPSRHDRNMGAAVLRDHPPREEGGHSWKEVRRGLGDKPS